MLELKLPFFGKRGTIKNIKENDSVYVVSRYGITDKQVVPKKKKNLVGLYKNYFDDTKEYLESSYDKYRDYKQILNDRKRRNKLKSNINIKKLKLAMLATVGAGCLFASGLVVLLPTSSVLLYLDMSALALSIVSLSALSNTLVNYLKDKKKDNFIKEYNTLEKELNEYNINNGKVKATKPTRYKGLSNENSHENTLHKSKKLKKEEVRNVA